MTSKKPLYALAVSMMAVSTLAAGFQTLPPPGNSNCPLATVLTCPQGSVDLETNKPGITRNGQCKILTGKIKLKTPPPAQPVQLGSYGFSQGTQIWKYVASIPSIQKTCDVQPI